MARPSSLTPDLSRTLARLVAQGNYLETAARLAGVGPRTVRTWLAKGKAEAEGPHHEFRQAIQKAEAAAEIRNLATVMKAARKDPKWAAWYLAHKHPERWSESRDEIRKLIRDVAELAKKVGKP